MSNNENGPSPENVEIKEIRSKAVLLCPDNDSESHVILWLAEKAGMAIIRSKQPHGAKLEFETDLELKLNDLKKPELWIVETPGIKKEEELINKGIIVKIIDHHTHNESDRLTDKKTGNIKPSSLEQFINMAKISDDEMRIWGFNPKTIRGIGIMDAKYVDGLKEYGYSEEEMGQVFNLQQQIMEEIRPGYADLIKLAEEDWKNRIKWNNYFIIKSSNDVRGMRSAISKISTTHNMKNVPMIISVKDGEKISVQNADPKIIKKLMENIKAKETYTFGSGYCWGVLNTNQEKKVTLEEILRLLE